MGLMLLTGLHNYVMEDVVDKRLQNSTTKSISKILWFVLFFMGHINEDTLYTTIYYSTAFDKTRIPASASARVMFFP